MTVRVDRRPVPDPVVGLPPCDVAPRVHRVRERLSATTVPSGGGVPEALLVTDLTNIRWLTGFTGSSGSLVVRPDDMVLVTDGRYADQAREQVAAADASCQVLEGRSADAMLEQLRHATSGFATVGFEAAHTTVLDHERLRTGLTPTLVPTTGIVEGGRRTKDDGEVARIAAACAIADAGLADVVPLLMTEPSEIEVRNALEARMRELGASGPSYETIVATGRVNAPLPHHRPDHTRLVEGDTVIIDVGALLDGYHSDMTRTFLLGEPSALQVEVYEVVRAAQAAGVAAVAPGVTARDLDAVCRDAIAAAGFGDWFVHGTGHGVGLLIHEDPFVGMTSAAVLQVGDVVTVEPGVYRGDLGGVRVEDLVLVTPDGCRPLTTTAKDRPCLPSPPTT